MLRGCVDEMPRLSDKEEEQLLQEMEDPPNINQFAKQMQASQEFEFDLQAFV